MNAKDHTAAIAAAKAEMERQKAQEANTLARIIDMVNGHLGKANKQRNNGWRHTLVCTLAVRAGVAPEAVAKALKLDRSSVYYHSNTRLKLARNALAVLDAAEKAMNNESV